jgi:hypothetical protein
MGTTQTRPDEGFPFQEAGKGGQPHPHRLEQKSLSKNVVGKLALQPDSSRPSLSSIVLFESSPILNIASTHHQAPTRA